MFQFNYDQVDMYNACMFQVIKTLQRAVKHCTAQQAREFATLVDREVNCQRLKSSASST